MRRSEAQNHSVIPATGLLPALLLIGLRCFLHVFFSLQLFADELPHLLSLIRVVLFICVRVTVALDLLAWLKEESEIRKSERRMTRMELNVAPKVLTYLVCIFGRLLLFFPFKRRIRVKTRKYGGSLMQAKAFIAYLLTAGTELSLGSSFRRSWLLLLFPFSVWRNTAKTSAKIIYYAALLCECVIIFSKIDWILIENYYLSYSHIIEQIF